MAVALLLMLACAPSDFSTEEESIRSINRQYVSCWLQGDRKGVLGLFTTDAVLSPNTMSPLKGIKAIEKFWFPDDGSATTIDKFTSKILSIDVDGEYASSTQKTQLSWTYRKGDQSMSREQWGYQLATYRKQADGRWKIWRLMWTDYRIAGR